MAFTGETYQLVDGDSVNGAPATGSTAAWNKKQLAMGGVLGLVLGVGAGAGVGYGIWSSDSSSSDVGQPPHPTPRRAHPPHTQAHTLTNVHHTHKLQPAHIRTHTTTITVNPCC